MDISLLPPHHQIALRTIADTEGVQLAELMRDLEWIEEDGIYFSMLLGCEIEVKVRENAN